MSVAICRDDLWLGVKSQSNPEIAGSLRNPFRWSVIESSLFYCKQAGPQHDQYLITLPFRLLFYFFFSF